MQSVLQLRPGETFHVGKSTFSLVPEEHSDLQGSNYHDYSQQVSQMQISQLRSDSVLLSSPLAKSPERSPISKQLVKTAITARETTPALPVSPAKRVVLQAIQEANKRSNLASPESPPPLMNNTIQQLPHGIDSILAETMPQVSSAARISTPEDLVLPSSEGPKTASEVPQQNAMERPEKDHTDAETDSATQSDEDMPKRKKRRLSAPPLEESQDSLYGKSIRVAAPETTSAPIEHPKSRSSSPTSIAAPEIPTAPIDCPKSRSSSQASIAAPKNTTAPTDHLKSRSSSQNPITVPPITPATHYKSRSTSQASSTKSKHGTILSQSVEPPSSLRSTRSAIREDPSPLGTKHGGIRVLFASTTNVGNSANFTKFLAKHDVQIVHSVANCTILCVGKELKKSAKLISAVLLGKDLVTDDWVIDSAKQAKLQNMEEYFPRDTEREAEWKISLTEGLRRGKEGIKVFEGWNIAWTVSARKEVGKSGFADLKEITSLAGANVLATPPKKGPEDVPSTIVIGTPEDAKPSSSWQYYTRDVISLSVLRGKLDIESDEFKISKPGEGKEGKKRKR